MIDVNAPHSSSALHNCNSSQPMAVPAGNRRKHCDVVDGADSTILDPGSSHKSNFSTTQSLSLSDHAEESLASVEDEEKIRELLMVFDEPDRSAVRKISAASNVEDLALMVKLWQSNYFKGEHHLEEICYYENMRRSQLLQLLDKFRDVLIIYETEDPVIASLYNQT